MAIVDNYDSSRLAGCGVLGLEERNFWVQLMGTPEAFLQCGLVRESDLPQGRKRHGATRTDELGSRLWVERPAKAMGLPDGYVVVHIDWDTETRRWLRARAEAEGQIAALPSSETERRERVKQLFTRLFAAATHDAQTSQGGYKMDLDPHDLADVFQDLMNAIDRAPVRFSRSDRDAEIASHRAKAASMDPRFGGFMGKLLSNDVEVGE
jgi:hypothetical protein